MRLFLVATIATFTAFSASTEPDPANWGEVTEEARGQTVYWNAWGGSDTINSFIGWIGSRVSGEYDVSSEPGSGGENRWQDRRRRG